MGTTLLTLENVRRRSSEAMSEYAFRHARAQLGKNFFLSFILFFFFFLSEAKSEYAFRHARKPRLVETFSKASRYRV
jgi:hypothetical protein